MNKQYLILVSLRLKKKSISLLVTGLLSLNFEFNLSACSMKMDLGPLNVFPLPNGMMLSFVNRGCWGNTAEVTGLLKHLARKVHTDSPVSTSYRARRQGASRGLQLTTAPSTSNFTVLNCLQRDIFHMKFSPAS